MTQLWRVRNVRDDEYAGWSALFRGYCDFYQWPTSDGHQREIWRWIQEEKIMEALVAVRLDSQEAECGDLQGLAHLREWIRPLRATRCGYLDDLFVTPTARGSGAVDAIFQKIGDLAREREWPVVRWTTAADNERAQRMYERVSERTSWVTYDMTVPPSSAGGATRDSDRNLVDERSSRQN